MVVHQHTALESLGTGIGAFNHRLTSPISRMLSDSSSSLLPPDTTSSVGCSNDAASTRSAACQTQKLPTALLIFLCWLSPRAQQNAVIGPVSVHSFRSRSAMTPPTQDITDNSMVSRPQSTSEEFSGLSCNPAFYSLRPHGVPPSMDSSPSLASVRKPW
jgi:hypothetical protein